MLGTGNVGESLVDGNPLDQRCEVAHHLHDGIAETLIFLEVAADEDELRTKLASLPSRHCAAYPESLCFIRCCEHNAATDRDWPAAQRGVQQLFDRRIKRIEVCMKDGRGCFHRRS